MKRILRILGISIAVLMLITVSGVTYLLLLKDRAPAQRPDLVRVPADLGPPPKGYPTQYAAVAAYFLGIAKGYSLSDEIETPPTVRETMDVEYGRVGDHALLLDLYEPVEESDELRPGIIFIHGGSWRGGFRGMLKMYTVDFAERGYVAATISYRFQQVAPFPAAVEDAKCAVRWMRANAEELGVDPDRIAVAGGSAGAHLAMMVGYTADDPTLEGNGGHEEYSSEVAAVINIYGPTNFLDPKAWHRHEIRDFLRAEWDDQPELWQLASPITHVRPDSPPTLIVHGTTDMLVEVSQADDLAERMQEVGAEYWYDRIDGYPHAMDIVFAVNERVREVSQAFLDEYMNGSRSPVRDTLASTH
jgi:acetyl esterase/lipase